MTDERESAVCPECNRKVRTVIPPGGDGSADIYTRHVLLNGRQCPESRQIVRKATSDG